MEEMMKVKEMNNGVCFGTLSLPIWLARRLHSGYAWSYEGGWKWKLMSGD